MNNIFFVILFALAFACATAYIAKDYELPLIKRRLIFLLSFFLGAFLYLIAINLFYSCDQSGCGYYWGDPQLKGK